MKKGQVKQQVYLLNKQTQGPKRKEAAAATAPPPPSAAAVRNRPKFRKYGVEDFSFLKVLGKGR